MSSFFQEISYFIDSNLLSKFQNYEFLPFSTKLHFYYVATILDILTLNSKFSLLSQNLDHSKWQA